MVNTMQPYVSNYNGLRGGWVSTEYVLKYDFAIKQKCVKMEDLAITAKLIPAGLLTGEM